VAVRIYVDAAASFEPAEREEWMVLGPCNNYDPSVFFPEGKGDTVKRFNEAKKICKTKCSVRLKCLAYTLAHEKGTSRRYGVAGGMGPTERENLQEQLDKMQEAS
jgi:hypothetical protein